MTGEVVPVDSDGMVTPQTNVSGPVVGIDDFRNDARFDGIDGSGQAVVIIDSGIDLDDPFFGADANGNGVSDRIVFQYDFADNDANAGDLDALPIDRKSTRLNSSPYCAPRMPSSPCKNKPHPP